MRGGSKLGGEIFNRDPDAIMWHEPLAAYYMSTYGLSFANLPQHTLYDRNLKEVNFSGEEIESMSSYLTNLLTCQLNKLPPETWMHKFLFFTEAEAIRSLRFCLQPKRQHAMVDTCKHLGQICGHTVESRIKRCPLVLNLTRHCLREMTDLPHDRSDEEKAVRRITKELQHQIEGQLSRINTFHLNAIVKHELCVEKMRRSNLHCMEEGIRQCQKVDIHVAKVNRMKIGHVERLLARNPDLHIIHYVRDPRAIATSRIDRGLCTDRYNPDLLREVDLICRRIRDDIHDRKLLETRYPNSTYLLRYEDLVLDPLGCVRSTYKFLDKKYQNASKWQTFFQEFIYGTKDHLSVRKNGTESISKWRSNLSIENIISMTELCQDVIHELGYDLV
ncbi:hypothetical protein LSH36_3g19058 [Paralvinella palmiformis]|uniref:Sulfotransferase n=1 Tax=Paralvinella palmiformis TaxID=53620 RepID=A0AAD9NJ17_9ANNE|nr:hypothetical protein LSH36_3g19058 [Paralvinella palmiformis]